MLRTEGNSWKDITGKSLGYSDMRAGIEQVKAVEKCPASQS